MHWSFKILLLNPFSVVVLFPEYHIVLNLSFLVCLADHRLEEMKQILLQALILPFQLVLLNSKFMQNKRKCRNCYKLCVWIVFLFYKKSKHPWYMKLNDLNHIGHQIVSEEYRSFQHEDILIMRMNHNSIQKNFKDIFSCVSPVFL